MKMRKQIIEKGGHFINVGIQVSVGKQGDYYVVYCPALELSSYGKTETEARNNFETELAIFLEETEKRGTLEKILLKLGWCLTHTPSPVYAPPIEPKASIEILHPRTFTEMVAMPL